MTTAGEKMKKNTAACLCLLSLFSCLAAKADDAPIGVFDSGLGGLTVLERLLDVDMVDNVTGKAGADGIFGLRGLLSNRVQTRDRRD